MATKQFEITYWTKDALKDIDPTKLGLKGSPAVGGKILTIDVGGKDTQWIDGTTNPEAAAKELVDKLEAKGLLKLK